MPSLTTALGAIANLSGLGPQITLAKGLVDVVVDMFDGEPEAQEQLKAKYEEAKQGTDAALDRLEEASRPKG